MKERGAHRSWPMPAYCANERLGYKNDYVSWSHLLVGHLFGKKKNENTYENKKQPVQPEGLWHFCDAVFIPRASNEEVSKIHLAFERE